MGFLHVLRNKPAHVPVVVQCPGRSPLFKICLKEAPTLLRDPPGKFCFSAAESYIALAVLALLHPFRNEDDTPSPLCSLLLGSQNNTVHAKSDKIS